ncbi:HAD family hydrolase [Streptosporangium algeriense]|uniref:HAD family hydrolase n=1 Tax=Streptosporangium algeriense TaxID=1682748 RepID=A0ABW3DY64_9ACTN
MLRGVLIDWGGVLTTNMTEAIAEWITVDRIDAAHYHEVMRELITRAYDGARDGGAYDGGAYDGGTRDGRARDGGVRDGGVRDGGENLVHALERGEISGADFERRLAALLVTLDGVPPVAEGLLARMFAGFRRVEPMYGMLREARAAGVRTCLLSNSWANEYPREGWEEFFDAVVISGEVGMRKPEPGIFEHALGALDLTGPECVFVDDAEVNVAAARALGIVGLHHRDPEPTIAELERLLGMPLRAVSRGQGGEAGTLDG